MGTIVNIFHGWFLTRVALNTVLPKSYWFVKALWGTLKALNDTKLIQNDHLSKSDPFRTNFVSIRTSSHPLFYKPITDRELLFKTHYFEAALCIIITCNFWSAPSIFSEVLAIGSNAMTTSKSQPLLFMILVIAEVMASTTSSTAGMCYIKISTGCRP